MYTREIKLKHNELPAKINRETGEITELSYSNNRTIPDGKSKLNYKEFGMVNMQVTKKLEQYLSHTEMSILFRLIDRCNFNSNSLQPLNDSTSIRTLAEEFNLSTHTVPKVFNKLFKMGVYMQLKISEDEETKEYWVLNPYIFWRGRIKNDSLFITFANTDVAKLLS